MMANICENSLIYICVKRHFHWKLFFFLPQFCTILIYKFHFRIENFTCYYITPQYWCWLQADLSSTIVRFLCSAICCKLWIGCLCSLVLLLAFLFLQIKSKFQIKSFQIKTKWLVAWINIRKFQAFLDIRYMYVNVCMYHTAFLKKLDGFMGKQRLLVVIWTPSRNLL